MPRADSPKYNYAAKTGTADTLSAASVVGGNAIDPGRCEKGSLSALVEVLADTNTFTWTAQWQVSSDNSTWVNVVAPNNAANVTLATGTAGTDTKVTRAIVAPQEVWGWAFARLALITGGTTGAAIDTYSIGYCYRDLGAGSF